MNQTREDQAINRRVAKRLGTWSFLDHNGTARESARREYANALTGARVRGVVAPKIWTGADREG